MNFTSINICIFRKLFSKQENQEQGELEEYLNLEDFAADEVPLGIAPKGRLYHIFE